MGVEREVGADCARARASGVEAPGGPARLGLFARVSLLPFLVACGSGDGPPTASEPLPEGVDTAVRGMRTYVTRDGIRRAVVEADTAEWREDNEIHLRRMTLTFFDPNGLESTEVTAEFGIFHQLTGDLEAERSVVVDDRVDDQRIETERLRYRNADGRLLGDTVFQFVDPGEGLTLDGTGFESDPALDSIVVMNQEGEMLPVVAFTEAIPLPAVPAAGDSVAAPPDTTEVLPDSVPAPPDSTETLPDSVPEVPDTAEALPDSVPVPPDSAAALPDSVAAPPDTTAARR